MANDTVAKVAFADIVKYISEMHIQVQDEFNDVWVVTATRVVTPESKRLNKELGLQNINKK
jgi:hypothetical protein